MAAPLPVFQVLVSQGFLRSFPISAEGQSRVCTSSCPHGKLCTTNAICSTCQLSIRLLQGFAAQWFDFPADSGNGCLVNILSILQAVSSFWSPFLLLYKRLTNVNLFVSFCFGYLYFCGHILPPKNILKIFLQRLLSVL